MHQTLVKQCNDRVYSGRKDKKTIKGVIHNFVDINVEKKDSKHIPLAVFPKKAKITNSLVDCNL